MPDVRNEPNRAIAIVQAEAGAAQDLGARLVTFPECFLQGYDVTRPHVEGTAVDLSGTAFAQVLSALRDLDVYIVLGLIERDSLGCYNSAVVLRRGELLARYRKKNLTDNERLVFRAGTETPIVKVDNFKASVNICYDLQFPAAAHEAACAGAQVLACPCNNMIRRDSAERWKFRHNEIRSMRAREANLWLVSSDVTGERGERISYGPTAVIDPDGDVRTQVPLLTEGIALWKVLITR